MLTTTFLTTAAGCLLMFLQQSPVTETTAEPPAAVARAAAGQADADATSPTAATATIGVAVIKAQEAEEAVDRVETGKAGFTVIYLRHADAREASAIVKQLFVPESGFVVFPDERTNALFLSGSDDQISQFRQVIRVLDADTPNQHIHGKLDVNDPEDDSVRIEVLTDEGIIILKGTEGAVHDTKSVLEKLTSRQEHVREEIQELQRRRAEAVANDLKAASTEEDLEALRQTVAEDFDIQQRVQLTEIEFLKARLAKLERRVKHKEQLKDRIIERRVEALLSAPAAKTATSTTTQTSRIRWSTDAAASPVIARDPSMSLRLSTSPPAAVSSLPQLLEIVKHAENAGAAVRAQSRDALILMRPDEFLEKQSGIEGQLAAAKSTGSGQGNARVKALERRLELLKAQLNVQIQSLKGELNSREAKLAARRKALEEQQAVYRAGAGSSQTDTSAAESEVVAAQSERSQVAALLDLYLKVQALPDASADVDEAEEETKADQQEDAREFHRR